MLGFHAVVILALAQPAQVRIGARTLCLQCRDIAFQLRHFIPQQILLPANQFFVLALLFIGLPFLLIGLAFLNVRLLLLVFQLPFLLYQILGGAGHGEKGVGTHQDG